MLETPLGDMEVLIDNVSTVCEAVKINLDKTCPNLTGRYCIKIKFIPDGAPHEIACCIKGHVPTDRDDIESGERLEIKSFYQERCKVSIGMEGDSGYYYEGPNLIRLDTYDYDNEYLENGVKYVILPFTTTSEYLFGIAWLDNVSEDNDVQTWYGADPTQMKYMKLL